MYHKCEIRLNKHVRQLMILFFGLVFTNLCSPPAYANGLVDWITGNGEDIIAEIRLDNECNIDSKYFVVKDVSTLASKRFFGGIAMLKTKKGAKLFVELLPGLEVKHIGVSVRAKESMDVRISCSARVFKFW